MLVGLLVLELYVHGAASLKDKRRVVRALLDGVRARHNVSAAETGHQELHARAEVAFAAVGADEDPMQRLFDRIVEEAERIVPGGVSETGREFLG